MRRKKSRVKIFKTQRAREWATDFMIGIGMFVLVAFFASTHTDSALPAPLAKTQAALERSTALQQKEAATTVSRVQTFRTMQFVSSQNLSGSTHPDRNKTSTNNILMVFMALMFSALMTLTIQFWRNLRRAYASPRRNWGKG